MQTILDNLTPVKFLIHTDGDLFAFLPEEKYNDKPDLCTCYAHIGQHSCCHIDYANESKEATKDQYSDLLQELIGQGYNNLKILNVDK